MRPISLLCVLFVGCGLAGGQAGQATVISGYASNWASPGVYAAPYVPLVTTPEISLDQPFTPAVGASSTTAGLVAGATNSTLSIVSPSLSAAAVSPSLNTTAVQPVTYGPMAAPEEAAVPDEARPNHGFEFGAASFQSSSGVAQLAASLGPKRRASRIYTNDDIEKIRQTTGTVKYEGKTEQLW